MNKYRAKEILVFYGFDISRFNIYLELDRELPSHYVDLSGRYMEISNKWLTIKKGFDIKFKVPMSGLTTESLIKLVEDIIEGKYK